MRTTFFRRNGKLSEKTCRFREVSEKRAIEHGRVLFRVLLDGFPGGWKKRFRAKNRGRTNLHMESDTLVCSLYVREENNV
jgi:hypothetical protein